MPTPPQNISDPIIKKYFDLIQANAPGVFKGFYYGDPIRIPASMLPALVCARRQTQSTSFTNAEDEHNMQLVFTVVTDIRKDITDDTSFVPGLATLYDVIEGRDPTTFLLKSTSLMQILRHNVDLNAGIELWTDVSTATKVDYGMTLGKRKEDSWSLEGSITIVAKLVQLR